MNSCAALECADTKTVRPTIRTGDLAVNLENRLVTVDGNPVCLTSKEYEILELLSLRKGTILTKEMFLNHLYAGMESRRSRSSMSSYVNSVRSWRRRAAGGITSRRCGVAAISSEIR